MTALKALLAGLTVAGALITAGVVVLVGVGWALVAAGVWITGVSVLLYDPKRRPRDGGDRRGGYRVRP